MEELVVFGSRQPFLEDWLSLICEILFVLFTALVFGFAHLPLTSEQCLTVEERNHFVERNLIVSLKNGGTKEGSDDGFLFKNGIRSVVTDGKLEIRCLSWLRGALRRCVG